MAPAPLTEHLRTLERRAHALDVAVHSVEVTVDGVPVLSAGSPTLGPHVPQRMYSVSKTVTGLAVGMLAAEGRLDLSDPVVRHFPDMAPFHPWLEATTLHDMLSMRGPHRSTTYKLGAGGWLESYFRVPPTHPPGTVFTYDTSAAYTLAALVERTAGTSLAEYLRPRLLDPIGVDRRLRFLTGPDGFSHGGSGMICTPRDLLRLAHLVLDGGVHDGVRLLPAEYLRLATSPQASPALQTWGAEFRGAYGYQTWLPPQGGWLMFGLGGQIVYGDPDRRIAVVVTADAQAAASGDQKLLGLVLTHLVDPLVAGPASPATPPSDGVVELSWPAPSHDASRARRLAGSWSALTDAGPRRMELDLHDDGGTVRSSAGWELPLSFSGPLRTTVGPQADPAVVTAGWVDGNSLDVRCGVHGDELATLRMRLVLLDDPSTGSGGSGTLAVQSQGFGETLDPGWTFHAAYSPAG